MLINIPDSTPPVWWVGHWWPNGAATAAGGPLVAHPRCAIWDTEIRVMVNGKDVLDPGYGYVSTSVMNYLMYITDIKTLVTYYES